MKDFTPFFFILVFVSILYIYLENKEKFVTTLEICNRKYLVRNLPDKQEAGKLLCEITDRLQKIVDHVYKNKNTYTNITYDTDKKLRDSIDRLKNNFKPENISESSPGNKYTSYSINKGEKLVFCIRSKDGKNTLVDINTMMFVGIHELAHLQSKSIGHTDEFWSNMKFLLAEGIKLCVYEHVVYEDNHKKYCGIEITGTPLDNPPAHTCSRG